ncbi:MAG: hypothetical protein LBC64_01875 [Fibromonadaceae bacterium]|jgi:hypothetical protein|nr:hypothetical protein [Fibromonadaceae bacterium]
MRTGVLIGFKESKPEIIKAGSCIAEQRAAYKKLVKELSEGGGDYDSVELYADPLRFARKGESKKSELFNDDKPDSKKGKK